MRSHVARAAARPGGRAAGWCSGPGPCRPGPGPRPATRPPRSHPGRRARPPARRPGWCRRRTRPRPSTTAGPTRWGTPPSRAARCGGPVEIGGVSGPAGSASGRVRGPGGPPPRWSATRCSGTGGPAGPGRFCAVGTADPGRAQGGQPHHDPRGAEAALAATGGHQGLGPPLPGRLGQAVEGGHLAAGQPADRGDAGHPGGAVDPDRAAPALALGAAAVLGRADAELLAQDVEQRRRRRRPPRRRRRRRGAGSAASADQLKEEPQPQVREALGLVTWNPAPCSPSL